MAWEELQRRRKRPPGGHIIITATRVKGAVYYPISLSLSSPRSKEIYALLAIEFFTEEMEERMKIGHGVPIWNTPPQRSKGAIN